MKKLLILAVLILGMVSCEKPSLMSPPQEKVILPLAVADTTPTRAAKAATLSILNTTNASQIPSQMFAVNPIYKTAYYHNKQPDGLSCSWTSYVNCINCIVTANNNYCYPTPISIVRYRCTAYYPEASTKGATNILALAWHLMTYDQGYIHYLQKSTSSRWEATQYMLYHITSYHTPFVVRSSINGIGHYRVVFSIDWKQSENSSIVYYTDCLYANATTFNGNLRSMSLSDFLTFMKVDANAYNMLFMWPN